MFNMLRRVVVLGFALSFSAVMVNFPLAGQTQNQSQDESPNKKAADDTAKQKNTKTDNAQEDKGGNEGTSPRGLKSAPKEGNSKDKKKKEKPGGDGQTPGVRPS